MRPNLEAIKSVIQRTRRPDGVVFDEGSKEAGVDSYLQRIKELPEKSKFDRSDLLIDAFLIQREGGLAIYYAPFDFINQDARLALVGITPGWQQMEIAFRVARQNLAAGLSSTQALRNAKTEASFAGTMRRNLIEMLDGIGVAKELDIRSTSVLFEDRQCLVHTTSAVRYPVFVHGDNYTGHSPQLMRTPVLLSYVGSLLADELQQCRDALIVPLGDIAGLAVKDLADRGIVDSRRCLVGFPHPSGANGHRQSSYRSRTSQLRSQVEGWYRPPRRVESSVPVSLPDVTAARLPGFTAKPIGQAALPGNVAMRKPAKPKLQSPRSRNSTPDELQLYSRKFCFEHVDGDLLYPVRLRSKTTGQLTFQVWDKHKSQAIEVDEAEMVQLVLKRNFAVRMKCPATGRNGGYRATGHSIRRVRREG